MTPLLITTKTNDISKSITIRPPVPSSSNSDHLGVNLEKLAYAVSQAETSGCTTGSAKWNNCFGIKGKKEFRHYTSKEESFADFKRIWKKRYKTYPTHRQAIRWTGGDRVKNWERIVRKYYYQE